MIDPADSLVMALEKGYQEELLYYTQALQIAERITIELKEGSQADQYLGQLNRLFAQIAAVEARLAELPMPVTNSQGGTTIIQAKEKIIAVIEKLVVEIRTGEREALARRDRLIIPVEMGIRVRRMQQAYGQGG